jgi:hypothetical protein
MTFMGHVAQDSSLTADGSFMPQMHDDVTPAATDEVAPPPRSHGMGGFLATCLVLIMAVLAAVAGLRSHHQLFTVAMFPTGRIAARLRSVVPRAPTLEELCLLRT